MMETYFESGGLAVASGGPILITQIGGDVTLDYLRVAREAGRRLADRYGRIASLTMLVPGLPMPAAEARAQATQDATEANRWLAAGATVVRERGFRASVTRSILLGITALQSGPPRKVFDDTAVAVDWIATKLEVPDDARNAVVAWCDRA